MAHALAKLAATLGVDPDEAVEVELGEAPTEVLDTLRAAAAEHRQLEIEYYSFGRDEWTTRVIDVHHVFSSAGQWYVSAFCRRVDDDRLFRVDRMRDARLLDDTFKPRRAQPPPSLYSPRDDDPLVVLELEPEGRWVVEQYPHEGVEELDGGRCRLRLRISERAFLERLLLRLGPAVRVVDGDATAAADAAARILARYKPG